MNGRPFTVTQLRALGSRLLNIHGQHDGQQLLDEEQHQLYLDSFGKTEELLNTYTEKYQAFTEIHRQIRALQMDESEKARRVDTLRYPDRGAAASEAAPRRGGGALRAAESSAKRGKVHRPPCPRPTTALNGGDEGAGALGFLRQAQDAHRRVCATSTTASPSSMSGWRSIYSEVYDVAATVEDQRDELRFFAAVSWTTWRAGWIGSTA